MAKERGDSDAHTGEIEDVVVVDEETPEWYKDEMGFEYTPPPEEETPYQSLEDLDYQTLYKVAKRLGYSGRKRSRKKLAGFSSQSIMKYLKEDEATKNDLVEYLCSYGIDVDDVISEGDKHDLVVKGKPDWKYGMHVRTKRHYVRATEPAIAKTRVELDGIDNMIEQSIPCAGWIVTDVMVVHPTNCGMPEPKRKLHTRRYYSKRLNERLNILESCKPLDFNCIKSTLRGVAYYKNKLDNYPLFPIMKCWSGNFNCIQGRIQKEAYDKMLEEKREIIRMLNKMREQSAGGSK